MTTSIDAGKTSTAATAAPTPANRVVSEIDGGARAFARRMADGELRIENPCHESWEAMAGDSRRRFCDACREQVHDLSVMREAEARALVRASGASLCVRYRVGSDGTVRFADFVPRADLMRRLARTAVAATLLAACTAHGDGPSLHEPDAASFTVHEPPATRVPESPPESLCDPPAELQQTPVEPPNGEPRQLIGVVTVDLEKKAAKLAALEAEQEAQERRRLLELERRALEAEAAAAQ